MVECVKGRLSFKGEIANPFGDLQYNSMNTSIYAVRANITYTIAIGHLDREVERTPESHTPISYF